MRAGDKVVLTREGRQKLLDGEPSLPDPGCQVLEVQGTSDRHVTVRLPRGPIVFVEHQHVQIYAHRLA